MRLGLPTDGARRWWSWSILLPPRPMTRQMMNMIKALGQAVGIDGDDAKIIATGLIVVVVVGVGLVILGAFLGLAVAAFSLGAGVF